MQDVESHRPRALITGGNAGIGRATAVELARRGYEVVITSRQAERGASAVARIQRESGRDGVACLSLDLADFASVRACAAEVIEQGKPLAVLVNNAGTIRSQRALSVDGNELTLQINHLGHFLLTTLLLEGLGTARPSRIINVSSEMHSRAKAGLDFDDLQMERGYGAMRAYSHSKLANIYFTRALSRRLEADGVTVNAVHPGGVRTELGSDGEFGGLTGVGWWLMKRVLRSPSSGARPVVRLATSDDVAGVSGAYFARMKQVTLRGIAADAEAAERLWAMSEQLVAAGPL
jgi:NAD(P)-dependent dehydrogenase (short-subunit alcohol dehydrogenase family)